MNHIKVLGDFSSSENGVDVGKMKTIYEDEKNRFVFVNLKGGEQLKKHTSPYNLTVFVLAGTGNILTGMELEEDLPFKEGMLFQIDKNVTHEVHTESGLKLLLVQTK